MSSTNKTLTIELSQYVGTDKPTYLSDYNGDMLKIDNAIAADRDSIATAQSKADGADAKADTNAGAIATLDGQINNASNGLTKRVTDVEGDVNTIESLIGNGTPTTTDKTIIGAINEIDARITSNAYGTTVSFADNTIQSGNFYTCPNDGYIDIATGATSGCIARVAVYGADANNSSDPSIALIAENDAGSPSVLSLFVKKGMKLLCEATGAGNVFNFIPLA